MIYMKRINVLIAVGILLICLGGLALEYGVADLYGAKKQVAVPDNKELVNVAYVTSETKELPDPNLVTHIFYAFAEVKPDFSGVDIINPERFQQILDLRKINPDLKICLSVGGYRKEGFSEVAASKKYRKAFCDDLKNIVNKYNLAGIDLDWEFPTTTNGGHTASPDDDMNYGRLVKDLRKALGKNKLITFYSNNGAAYINMKVMVPYVDYVMVSGYNIGLPPEHQSNLYTSDLFPRWSVDRAIEKHRQLGVPYSKMLMGIPLYARTSTMHLKSGSEFTYLDRIYFPEYLDTFEKKWDDVAKAPYSVDKNGKVVATYDTPESIGIKAEYIRNKGLAGGFYWHYCSEDTTHAMARAMHQALSKP